MLKYDNDAEATRYNATLIPIQSKLSYRLFPDADTMYTLGKTMQVTPPNELDRFDNATHLFRRAPNRFRVAHKKHVSCVRVFPS
jgi:hypothetical protein